MSYLEVMEQEEREKREAAQANDSNEAKSRWEFEHGVRWEDAPNIKEHSNPPIN